MTDKVRVGIVGTSWYADLMHLPILFSDSQATTVAICGRNRERAEEMAQKYGIRQVYTDYRSMIEQGELGALIVATPDDLHYPMTMDALDAGLHVLCEKPLAQNAGQAQKMLDKAEEAGVKHMTYFTWRWMPHLRYVHELVEDGYIGACYDAHFHYRAGGGRAAHYDWHYDRRRANGILGNFGAHMIDAARWCIGEIAGISAHLATFVERPDPNGQPMRSANDSAMLMLDFENGAQCAIHVSGVAHVADRGQEQLIILHGEDGTLEAEFGLGTGYTVRGARHDEEAFKPLDLPEHILQGVDQSDSVNEQFRSMFTGQLIGTRQFIDAILNDRPVSPSFRDGLIVQEAIDAALESDRQGCRIALPRGDR